MFTALSGKEKMFCIVLQQCSGEAAMSGTVARASREGLSAAPCCLGVALLRLNEAAGIEFLRTKREGGREGEGRELGRVRECQNEKRERTGETYVQTTNASCCIFCHCCGEVVAFTYLFSPVQ